MGTSLACIYATIYYSYHEETRIYPTYSQQSTTQKLLMPAPLMPVPTPHAVTPLLLHARLIDDAIQIWDAELLQSTIQTNFVEYMANELKFGSLTWEVGPLTRKVDFLDLTIQLNNDGSITTKTFVKPMNLHLYIPPHSAHPLGVLKSLIFGNVLRYWNQNTHRHDFIEATSAFYGHLLNRGYTPEKLTPIFQEAAATIDTRSLRLIKRSASNHEPLTADTKSNLFLHWEYHPRDIPRQLIRKVFNDTIMPALIDSPISVTRITIAYSTPRSLAQCLTKTQLREPDGHRVSQQIQRMLHPANL